MFKYRLKKIPKKKLIVWTTMIMIFFISLGSIVGFYAATNVYTDVGSSTISESTVIVNDLETDWNYYMGLNYTEVTSTTALPGVNSDGDAAESSGRYNSKSLVAVQINYSGVDVNNSALVGTVTSAETQNKYTYYKYYPITDGNGNVVKDGSSGYITIELIDNPFTKRPVYDGITYGFNGWGCVDDTSTTNDVDCKNVTISFDRNYYIRTLTVPVSAVTTNSYGDKLLNINLRASWTPATVVRNSSTLSSFSDWGMKVIGRTTTNNVTSYYFSEGQSTVGYYYKVSGTYTSDLYYNASGESCSVTTCNGSAYKLIQSSDSFATYTYDSDSDGDGVNDYSSLADNYYYLVTRDTNLLMLTSGTYSLNGLMNSVPFTITGNGAASAYLTIGNNSSCTLRDDLNIDNVYLTSNASTDDYRGANRNNNYYLNSSSFNLKVGRNVQSNDSNNFTAQVVYGGENNRVIIESGSYNWMRVLPTGGTNGNHSDFILGSDYDRANGSDNSKLLVYFQVVSSSAGNQNSVVLTPASEMIVKSGTFGYDLLQNKYQGSGSYYTYGIYAGGIAGGESTAFRTLKVEGGRIFSINGGPCISSGSSTKNVVGIYMTGGVVDNVVGGAGTSATYGQRIVSITGGTINNSVAGGSNSYAGSGGALNGSTLVYVGGNATLGGTVGYFYEYHSSTMLYGIEEKGSVFGAGLGKTNNSTTLGRVNNAHVIIDGNATINGSVYGGGNYGSVGTASNYETNTVVDILGGNIVGSVFGAANNNGAGVDNNNNSDNENISYLAQDYYIYVSSASSNSRNYYGRNIQKGYYYLKNNGSNTYTLVYAEDTVACNANNYTTVEVDRRGETYYSCPYYSIIEKDSEYSAYYRYYELTSSGATQVNPPKTYVISDEDGEDTVTNDYYHTITINLNVDMSEANSKIAKSVYGGSNTTGNVYGNVYINLYSGRVSNADYGVYGGGYGASTIVYGHTIIKSSTTDDSKLLINDIYGGSELGTVNEYGYTSIDINGGTINTVYGGGKGDAATSASPSSKGPITVNINDGLVTDVFGGNNEYGTLSIKPTVNIKGGNVTDVYGGSNGSGAGIVNTLVNVSGGTITDGVYGGGKSATTTETTEVNITGGTFSCFTNADGERACAEVFGGGRKAAVNISTTVNIKDGANVYNVYGGSNESGDVHETYVNNIGGNVLCNTYGGGKRASVDTSNNILKGTTYTYSLASGENSYINSCGNAFAGGAEADVVNANITLDGSSLINVYGGSDKNGIVTNANVSIVSGSVINVFGGNNQGGNTVDSFVKVDTLVEEKIYKDENGKEITEYITPLSIQNVFGGSNGSEASITNTTKVDINSGYVAGNIYGGGNKAPVIGSTNVNIYKGYTTNVFGGGNEAHVGNTVISEGNYVSGSLQGKTVVNVISGTILNNVYGSGNSSFVDGTTEVNIGDDAIIKLNITDTSGLTYRLKIMGSVFGGSETNTDGETVFDNSFVGVYDTASINIDGKSYIVDDVSNLTIKGSINGGGNNSMVKGVSTIYIDNYGTMTNPTGSTSIQRASNVYVTDSYFQLSGTRNRATTDSYKYSIISVGSLYLLGSDSSRGSHLYLVTGATYFGNLYSGSFVNGVFKEQTVTDNNGTLVRGVSDNRLYMVDKNILAVTGATNAFASYDFDSATPGEVHGMAFLGLYELRSMSKGIYDYTYANGSEYDSSVSGTISSKAYTYVYGINYTAQTEEEQIKTNGFYTNVLGEDGVTISYEYVGVTPKDAPYYKWVLGEEPIVIQVDLIADKYSESGTVNKNIPIADLLAARGAENPTEWSDATLKIVGVNTSSFVSTGAVESYNGYLVDKSEVPTVNTDDANGDGVIDANNYFALSMGTTTSGWLDNYKTNFYSDKVGIDSNFCTSDDGDGGCTNDDIYLYDSTNKQRSLSFWLYHSKNLDFSYIDKSGDPENMSIPMGRIDIYTILTNPHGDPNNALENNLEVTIEVYVYLSDGELDKYGGIIAPGKQYEVFQGKPTTIASDGAFSIYQSLSLDLNGVKAGSACDEKWSVDKLYNTAGYETVLDKDCNENTVYWSEAYRYLASSYLLPVGTVITMLDLKNDKQYYYEVTQENYDEKSSTFAGKNQYKYYLEDFVRMGSTTLGNLYDDDMNDENSEYYYYKDSNLAVEEFIFTVDFSNADNSSLTTSQQHSFYLQLERYKSSSENNIDTAGVAENILSTDIDKMVYTIVPNVNSVISTTGGYLQSDGTIKDSTTIYVGEDADLSLTTSLLQYDNNNVELNGVSDTVFDDYKLGAKITVLREKVDKDGNVIAGEYEQVTSDLFGTVMTINGKSYYPQTDGSTRIELAGRITDVTSSINIDFENSDLTFGNYILVVETFVSYDGLYYGDFTPTYNEFAFTLLNNQYGLNASVYENVQITHDVNSGEDADGNTQIHYVLESVNGLANPNLKVSLQRREYSDDKYYSTTYSIIDLQDISTGLYFKDNSTNIFNYNNGCYKKSDDGICLYYNLSKSVEAGELIIENIDKSTEITKYDIYLTLKEGPDSSDLTDLNGAKWKSGTYRVVFTLFDGDTEVGSVYEYLIIRSLGIDEIIEGSGN